MHDVVPARPDQRAELFDGHRLVDVLACSSRIDDAWQPLQQPREAVRDVGCLRAPRRPASSAPLSGHGGRDDEQTERTLPRGLDPSGPLVGLGNHLASDGKALDEPAVPIAQQLPGIPHQLARHLQHEMHGAILRRLDLGELIADAVENVVAQQAAAARQPLQGPHRLRGRRRRQWRRSRRARAPGGRA